MFEASESSFRRRKRGGGAFAAAGLFLLLAGGCGQEGTPEILEERGWWDVLRVGPAGGRVAVQVLETAGLKRVNEHVRFGFPLPPGALRDPAHLAVLGEQAEEPLPCQVEVTARWPDGSIRWVALEVLLSLSAGENQRLWVRYGRAAFRPQGRKMPVVARQRDDGCYELDTGRLLVVVDPAGPAILSAAYLDLDGDGRYSVRERVLGAVGDDGVLRGADLKLALLSRATLRRKTLRASRDHPHYGRFSVTLERDGPLWATLLISGWHVGPDGEGAYPFRLRLSAQAGGTALELQHTFVVDCDPEHLAPDEMALEFYPDARQRLAGPEPRLVRVELPRAEYPDFRRPFPPPVYEQLAGQPERRPLPPEAAATFTVPTKFGGLTAAVRDFLELAPKGFRTLEMAGGHGLAVEILPPGSAGSCELRSPEVAFPRQFALFARTESFQRFWLREDAAGEHLRQQRQLHCGALGAARTTHLLLILHQDEGREAQRQARAFQAPLAVFLPPVWYEAEYTRALGRIPRLEERFKYLVGGARKMVAWIEEHQRERFGWYGMFEYGNFQSVYRCHEGLDVGERWWNWHGRFGWLQDAGGWKAGLLRWAIAWQDPQVLRLWRAAVEASFDLGTRHADFPDPRQVGRGFYPGATPFSGGTPGYEYCFPQAWLEYYYFTGEARAREVLLEAIEALKRHRLDPLARADRRETADGRLRPENWKLSGGELRLVAVAYQLTGEAFYREVLYGALFPPDERLLQQAPVVYHTWLYTGDKRLSRRCADYARMLGEAGAVPPEWRQCLEEMRLFSLAHEMRPEEPLAYWAYLRLDRLHTLSFGAGLIGPPNEANRLLELSVIPSLMHAQPEGRGEPAYLRARARDLERSQTLPK